MTVRCCASRRAARCCGRSACGSRWTVRCTFGGCPSTRRRAPSTLAPTAPAPTTSSSNGEMTAPACRRAGLGTRARSGWMLAGARDAAGRRAQHRPLRRRLQLQQGTPPACRARGPRSSPWPCAVNIFVVACTRLLHVARRGAWRALLPGSVRAHGAQQYERDSRPAAARPLAPPAP